MHKMPPTVPVSDLRNEQDEILQMMDEQPVMLTQRGKARAALVNIEHTGVPSPSGYRMIWGNRSGSMPIQ